MTGYTFIFGNTPELSWQELISFFPNCEKIAPSAGFVPDLDGKQAKDAINALGGVVKVGKVAGIEKEINENILVKYLPANKESFTFGLSVVGADKIDLADLVKKIKYILKTKNINVRYLVPKKGFQISSVTASKRHAYEVMIIKSDNSYIITQITDYQNYEDWSRRDYKRPFADPKLGMLPPKVARMIVNIALSEKIKNPMILDPFCGMGTILAESLLLGCNVYGSDISDDVTERCRKNISWITHEYDIDSNYHIFKSDAVHVSEKVKPNSIDAIVTEPYMGSSSLGEGRVNEKKAKNIIKGLNKLYIGCFKDWLKVLKKGSKVIIAIPQFHINGTIITVKNLVDTCENLGYTKVLEPIIYSRKKAIVRREFNFFIKK